MARGVVTPTLLSPSQAEVQLPIPCLLILQGVAQPIFSNRDRGFPSPVVLISRVSAYPRGMTDTPSVILPFPVDGRQWRTAVKPVLEDETWGVDQPLMASLMAAGGVGEYLRLLGYALRQSFIDAGWGPMG